MRSGFPGVLLLTMGGPPRLEDVRPFLYNLFRDPILFHFPLGRLLQTPFALLVSTLRAQKVRRRYHEIGGGSPLGEITLRQAKALEKGLESHGYYIPVAVAMRYWRPDTMQAVEEILHKNAERIIALPLYPQYSRATTGSSLHLLEAVVKEYGSGLVVQVIRSWWNHPGYLRCMALRIQRALDRIGSDSHVGLLFLAHSLPLRFVHEGDPYVEEVEKTVQSILSIVIEEYLGSTIPWYLAYQSRFGPIRWVGPSVEEGLKQMGAEGCRKIAVVPVSFVSDHLETLYDIDILYRRLAYRYGISAFERIEALNDAPDFIQCLTDLVIQKGLKNIKE
jgi:ferrochelatase